MSHWFKEAGWGVFFHYLGSEGMSAEAWNERVDSFDTLLFAQQLAQINAGYCFFTIGQNSGHYCAPNETYDEIVGIVPSKCSKRDLIADLAAALAPVGIPLLVYLPSGAPTLDQRAQEKLEWEWGSQTPWPDSRGPRKGKRLASFQRKWEAIIREWSLRWGEQVKGWWFDGCYFAEDMYQYPDPPNFESFAQAAKAGNPGSIVAFNPGVRVPVTSLTEYEDYTAGEISTVFPVARGPIPEKVQYHILTYLGATWGGGKPRFCTEFVVGYTKQVIGQGGTISWDVPIGPTGEIPGEFLEQLGALASLRE